MSTGKMTEEDLHEIANALENVANNLVKDYVQECLCKEYIRINSTFRNKTTRNNMLKHFKSCIMDFIDKNLSDV